MYHRRCGRACKIPSDLKATGGDGYSGALRNLYNGRKNCAILETLRKYKMIEEAEMLSIYLGKMDEAIYYPPTYFDNRYEDEWITEPLTVDMIKDVDHSTVIGSHLIESPVLGPISVKELSGGVKTLILMAFDSSGKVFNASACGDNCAGWILKIGELKDLTINLRHIMDFGTERFEAKILNTGNTVHNMAEFIEIAGQYV